MKKLFLTLLIFFFCLFIISCGNEEEDENAVTDVVTQQPSIPSEALPTYPYFTVDKEVYTIGEEINVKLYNFDGCKKVSLTKYGTEPSANHEIAYKRISDSDEIAVKTTKVETAGDYTLWLLGEDFYEYLYVLDIHIDTEDLTDYGVKNATLKTEYVTSASITPNITKNQIIINSNHSSLLTYRLYWCKDGQRLNDYMAIRAFEAQINDCYVVNLPDNLFKPTDANQIEVAVMEGVSTSYFIDIDNTMNLDFSEYEFTFNAISDLHIQSAKDSLLFNAHLKKTLKTIYESDSKAIMAVGDIVNFGKAEEYEFLQTIFDEVVNLNNVGFYPAIGNHEYMYFNDMNEPLSYFKNHFNLDSHYYSFTINGYKFIVLGSDSVSGYGTMSSTQLNWFKKEIKSVEDNQPVFVMLHQPIMDTVDGTLYTKYGQTDYGYHNHSEFKSILNSNPNIILFSGHSHHTLEGELPVYYTNTKATFVTCGSNSYLNQYIGSASNSEIGGSEGLFVEVYADYILIRGKEFCYNRWVANCQIKIPRILK